MLSQTTTSVTTCVLFSRVTCCHHFHMPTTTDTGVQPHRVGRIWKHYNGILAQSWHPGEEGTVYKFPKPKFNSLSQRTITHKQRQTTEPCSPSTAQNWRGPDRRQIALFMPEHPGICGLWRESQPTTGQFSSGHRAGSCSSRLPGRGNMKLHVVATLSETNLGFQSPVRH